MIVPLSDVTVISVKLRLPINGVTLVSISLYGEFMKARVTVLIETGFPTTEACIKAYQV